MKARLTLAIALLLVCTGTGAALAQTPDDLPPARETVCDAETGAAYGFCNAYCEAMDCESDAPNASATACGKVRSKFENVTGRDVPCGLSCPCTSITEFNTYLATLPNCVDAGDFVILFEVAPFTSPAVAAAPEVCGVAVDSESEVFLPITPEESALCIQLLRDTITSRGLTCLQG